MDDTPSPFDEIQHPKQRAFLAALVEAGGNITRACEIVGINRATVYSEQWQGDAVYAAALARAKRMAAEALESEAIRRAYEGVERDTGWYQGKPGGVVREYSDTLAIFLLKGLMPEKYSEKVEVRGAFAGIDLARLPDEALSRIAAGEHPNSVLASLVQDARAELPPADPSDNVPDDSPHQS
jgi:hypothetical protein